MSTYSTIQGQLRYPNEESFLRVVKDLQEGHYMDADGYWLDEMEHRLEYGSADEERPSVLKDHNNALEIPIAHWRNLCRYDFFLKKEDGSTDVKGTVVGTSTDGMFQGWVIEDGHETDYDLDVYAAGHDDIEAAPVESEYNEPDGYEGDQEDYFQNLCIWQQEVENEFHCEFAP